MEQRNYVAKTSKGKNNKDETQTSTHVTLVDLQLRNSVKDVQKLPGADIDSDHNLLVAKICTRLKKIIRFQKRRPQWDLEKLYTQKQTVQGTLGRKLGAIECDSRNVEV
jgi:hypothetical protein